MRLHCDEALLPQGWSGPCEIHIGDDGRITDVLAADGVDPDLAAAGPVLPGIPNVHSHAFQRAMAGLAERHGGRGDDDFWSWRETMYAFAQVLDPAQLEAIATQLYVEMLEAGYTTVCEFHYLHHRPGGAPYDDPTAMAQAIRRAARAAGIRLVLLPVLYMTGGFDARALAPRQRRFAHEPDAFLDLVARLRAGDHATCITGIALHSLRAVPPDAMRRILADPAAKSGPIHIHVAEQMAEVEDCLAQRGARPVRWLLEHAEVDARWCLVHATHLDAREIADLARSGATVGLCPTTEANLGDGIFPFEAYRAEGGRWAIGSDSHVSVSPVEELRWLEYAQRLMQRRRTRAADANAPHVGANLVREALSGGATACAQPLGAIERGALADLVVLDRSAPNLAARAGEALLDSWVFSGNRPCVRDVMVQGRWVVRGGRHVAGQAAAAAYARTVAGLPAGAARPRAL